MIPYSTRRNNELEISYQTCAGKGRRLALCIWNEVFTGLPAGNDMQRQNDLRVGVSSIHGWWPPSVFVAAAGAAENARRARKKLASARFKYHQLVFGYYSWFVKSQCETNVRRAQNGKSFFSQLLVNYISMYNTYLLSLQKHHNLLRSFSRNCTSYFRAICGKFSCCF